MASVSGGAVYVPIIERAMSDFDTVNDSDSTAPVGTYRTLLNISGSGGVLDYICTTSTAFARVKITVDGNALFGGSYVLTNSANWLVNNESDYTTNTPSNSSQYGNMLGKIVFESSLLVEWECNSGTATTVIAKYRTF